MGKIILQTGRLLRRTGIVFIFCMLSLLLAACASTPKNATEDEADAHYKLGLANLNENRIQQAFVEFQKAYSIDPSNKQVLNALGLISLLNLDEKQKAIEYFQKAVSIDPNYSDAYNNLGYAYEKLGRFDSAIANYRKALANPLYPTAEKAYYNMGNAYYRVGKFEEAEASFKNSINRAPEASAPYLRLALCYNALRRFGDAALAMTQAIKLDPVYQGNKEKAIEDFSQRRLKAVGQDEQDLRDYLDILKY